MGKYYFISSILCSLIGVFDSEHKHTKIYSAYTHSIETSDFGFIILIFEMATIISVVHTCSQLWKAITGIYQLHQYTAIPSSFRLFDSVGVRYEHRKVRKRTWRRRVKPEYPLTSKPIRNVAV